MQLPQNRVYIFTVLKSLNQKTDQWMNIKNKPKVQAMKFPYSQRFKMKCRIKSF